MSLEVYSTARPAVSRRTWGMAGLLFLLACGLAAGLSRSRVGHVLSGSIQPPDWNVSFRAPGRFEQQAHGAGTSPSRVVYRATIATGTIAELIVWRFDSVGDGDAGDVCHQIIRPHATFFGAWLRPPQTKRKETLGPWDALQSLHPAIPMVVRAAVLPSGEAYAVSLRVEGGAMDEKLYRVFNAVCESIVHLPGRGRRVI